MTYRKMTDAEKGQFTRRDAALEMLNASFAEFAAAQRALLDEFLGFLAARGDIVDQFIEARKVDPSEDAPS